jgi:hypothetical protein
MCIPDSNSCLRPGDLSSTGVPNATETQQQPTSSQSSGSAENGHDDVSSTEPLPSLAIGLSVGLVLGTVTLGVVVLLIRRWYRSNINKMFGQKRWDKSELPDNRVTTPEYELAHDPRYELHQDCQRLELPEKREGRPHEMEATDSPRWSFNRTSEVSGPDQCGSTVLRVPAADEEPRRA